MSAYVGRIQRYIVDRAPYWIRSGYGGAFLQALGLTLDTAQATMLHALRQTRPLVCVEDALPYLQADRGIRRYPTEPAESIRMRLAQWRQIKRHAGSHYGQMLNLRPFFLPGAMPTIYCVHQAGDGSSATWHKMDPNGVYSYTRATPSNFDFDGVPAKWSREFWFIDVSGTRLDGGATQYNDGSVFDGGQVYDGVAAASVVDMKAILDESKAAHTIIWTVALTTTTIDPTATAVTLPDGSTSLPTGNWGLYVDPATNLPTRPNYYSFYFDLGQG